MWYWEGPKLITETVRDVNGQTVRTKEVRVLEAAGSEMSVDTLLVVEHGYSQRGAQNYGSGKENGVSHSAPWNVHDETGFTTSASTLEGQFHYHPWHVHCASDDACTTVAAGGAAL